jgi:enoyl-CoA hydratase/carnithine racemase
VSEQIRKLQRHDSQELSVQGSSFFEIEHRSTVDRLTLRSADGTNRLTRSLVIAVTEALTQLAPARQPLIIAGNERFFSVGADLREIAALDGPSAYEFAKTGQTLMNHISEFPAPVCAAISGYCMGGGLDLALACHYRIASPDAFFGHRGAALGLMTGWGGTQRLPRLVGKARALQMFVAAENINAQEALSVGLVDAIAEDPVAAARERIS